MNRMRRLAVALAAVSVAAFALTACSTGPTDEERAAWSGWSEDLVAQSADGGLGGMMVDASDDALSSMDFSEPTTFRAVELRCIGTDRGHFDLRYVGTGGTVETSQDIVCHDGEPLTPIAIPTSVGALTTFEAAASSPDGEGYWAALPQR